MQKAGSFGRRLGAIIFVFLVLYTFGLVATTIYVARKYDLLSEFISESLKCMSLVSDQQDILDQCFKDLEECDGKKEFHIKYVGR